MRTAKVVIITENFSFFLKIMKTTNILFGIGYLCIAGIFIGMTGWIVESQELKFVVFAKIAAESSILGICTIAICILRAEQIHTKKMEKAIIDAKEFINKYKEDETNRIQLEGNKKDKSSR